MGEKKKSDKTDNRALYRKYRSKSLEEIIGQEHITKTLKNSIESGKLSHAYLFTGPRGVGKTSIARILAHEINDIPYTDDSIELDIIEIDAASNRRIDDIRDLREKVNLAPVNAKYKVYIIDEVHMLTTESFNALLKTLEEPPAHVIFILATTEVHKLPATIVSRTQRHTFRAVPQDQVTNHLADIANKENLKIDRAALELLAKHGEGSFRDSISLLDQISHLPEPVSVGMVEDILGVAPEEEITRLLDTAKKGNTQEIINLTRELADKGVSPSVTSAQLLQKLKDGPHENASLTLMQDLLKVSSAKQPNLSLEIALLGYALKSDTKHPDTEHKVKTVAATVVTQKISEPVVESPKVAKPPIKSTLESEVQPNTPEPTAQKSEETDKNESNKSTQLEEFWPDILATIKERNSSLYTVMRLAQPYLNDNTLLLSFQFPFHQKRAAEPKNLSLIAGIVSNQLDFTPVVETKIDKSLSKAPTQTSPVNTEPDPAHASLIASVQDIMGGGEILDARNT